MQARNEVAVLAALDHINIVKYYDCFTAERGRIQIVMELCEVWASDTFQLMSLHGLEVRVSHSSIVAHVTDARFDQGRRASHSVLAQSEAAVAQHDINARLECCGEAWHIVANQASFDLSHRRRRAARAAT